VALRGDDGERPTFVVADIPGLIPGASDGAGLGTRFLKHLERTRVFLHLISLDPGEGRDPLSDYTALRKELSRFDPELAKRPEIVAMSKADLPEVREAYPALRAKFRKKKIDLKLLSAPTKEGVDEISYALWRELQDARKG
jgi:GTP-binding protein